MPSPGASGALDWSGFTDAQRTQFNKDFFGQAQHGWVMTNPKHGLIGEQTGSEGDATQVGKPIIFRGDLMEKIGTTIRFFVTFLAGGPSVDRGVDLASVAEVMGYTSLEMGIKEHWKAFGENFTFTTDQVSYLRQYLQANKHIPRAVGQLWEIALHIHACGYKPTAATKTHNCFRDVANKLIDPTVKGWNMNPDHLTDYPYTGPHSQFRVLPSTLTVEEDITSTHTFSVAQMEKMGARLQDPNIGIPPCEDGLYKLFLHPFCWSDLKLDSRFKEVFVTHPNAPAEGKNIAVTGEVGHWDRFTIYPDPFVTPGIRSDTGAVIPTVRRNVVLGAGGLSMGCGKEGCAPGAKAQSLNLSTESKNHGQIKTVAAKWFGGVRRNFWEDDRDTVNTGRSRTAILPAYAPDTSVYT